MNRNDVERKYDFHGSLIIQGNEQKVLNAKLLLQEMWDIVESPDLSTGVDCLERVFSLLQRRVDRGDG